MSRRHKHSRPKIPYPFTWQPGAGLNDGCVQRLRSQLPRPDKPMGEAWFMGDERRMFDWLLGDLDDFTLEELTRPLAEIASGNSSFGPMDEWTRWYNYLLGQLVTRHGEQIFDSMYQHLVTAFIAVHPRGIEEPYGGFGDDALHTLGRCLMDPSRWTGDRLAAPAPEDPFAGGRTASFKWSVACGDFSAGMFFCAKYLDDGELDAWLDSAFAIRCPLWITQLNIWLLDAHPLLSGLVLQLADLEYDPSTSVRWSGSHVLKGDYSGDHGPHRPPLAYLPPGRGEAILAFARRHLTQAGYFAWLDAIKPYDYLQAMLSDRLNQFAEVFDLD